MDLFAQQGFYFDLQSGYNIQTMASDKAVNRTGKWYDSATYTERGEPVNVTLGYNITEKIGIGFNTTVFGLYVIEGDIDGITFDNTVFKSGLIFNFYLHPQFNIHLNDIVSFKLGIGPHLGIYNFEFDIPKTRFQGTLSQWTVNNTTFGIGAHAGMDFTFRSGFFLGFEGTVFYDFVGAMNHSMTGVNGHTENFDSKITSNFIRLFRL